MRKYKVAVVQTAPVPNSSTETVNKMYGFVKEAAEQGAELVVFPEAFIGGYPKGADFHISIGARPNEGRIEFMHYYDNAIQVPSEQTDQIGAIAAEFKKFIVVGIIEKDGYTLYCTVLFFNPEGKLLGKHRKLMPTAGERYIWGQGDGSTLTVEDTELGKLGAVICWENYMPLLRMAMYNKGVEIYCAPTADDRATWLPTMQHIAQEGRCFVLSACQVLKGKDFPSTFRNEISNDADHVLMRGGSCIIGPLGQILAGPVYDDDAVLVAEIDLDLITQAKFDFDVTGHYARPDIFQLNVNEQVMAPVVTK